MLKETFEKKLSSNLNYALPPTQIVETIPLVTKAHSDSRRTLCMELTHLAHMLHSIALHRIVSYRTILYCDIYYRIV